jgi:hypothetical protein
MSAWHADELHWARLYQGIYNILAPLEGRSITDRIPITAEEGRLHYNDIKEAFCRTLQVGNLSTDNATTRTIPIFGVCKVHDEAVAAISAGVDPFSHDTATDTFREQSNENHNSSSDICAA